MDLDIIASVQENIIGNCLCVLGDSMAMPVGVDGQASSATSSRRTIEAARARSAAAPLDDERRRSPTPQRGRRVSRDAPTRDHLRRRRPSRSSAPEGAMLVDAAKHGDVEIPVFCYEPKLGEPVGACRMCLVEIEGIPKLQTACSTPVRDGMVVYTQTDRVKRGAERGRRVPARQPPARLPGLRQGRRVPAAGHRDGLGRRASSRFIEPKRHFQKPLALSPLIAIDRERCILCYRCVRFSQEVAEDEQLQLLERGDRTFVGTFDDRPYVAPFHGNIIELCPVGRADLARLPLPRAALGHRGRGLGLHALPEPVQRRASPSATSASSACSRATTHEVDDGWLCDKGRFGYQIDRTPTSGSPQPLVRDGGDAAAGDAGSEALDDGRRRRSRRPARARAARSSAADAPTRRATCSSASSARRSAPPTSTRAPAARSAARRCAARSPRPTLAGDGRATSTYADAVLVLGADPLHEMPILDLRIRKAVRRNGAQLAVATEPPDRARRGAERRARASRRAPARRSCAALDAALAGDDGASTARRARPARDADAVRALADAAARRRRGRRDRLGRAARSPARAARRPRDALLDLADALGLGGSDGAGLLEVPTRPTAAACARSAACPDAGPGFADDRRRAATPPRSRDGARRRRARARCSSLHADPVRDLPDAARWERGARSARDFVVAHRRCSTDGLDRARRRRLPGRVLRREGGHGHPSRRPPPAPAPGDRPHPGDVRAELAGARRARAPRSATRPASTSAPRRCAAIAAAVPFYAGITLEEIGGRGVRWQERDGRRAPLARRRSASSASARRRAARAAEPPADGALRLGTYRDLWAARGHRAHARAALPARRSRALELAPADAERLGARDGRRGRACARTATRVTRDGRGPRRGCSAGTALPDRGHAPRTNANAARASGAAGRGRRGRGGASEPAARRHRRSSRRPGVLDRQVDRDLRRRASRSCRCSLLLERKLLGRFQNRYGPNRVGPFGLLQPLADVVQAALARSSSARDTAVAAACSRSRRRSSILTAVATLAIIPFGDVDIGRRRRPLRDRRLDRHPLRLRLRLDRLLRPAARRLGLGLEVLLPRRDALAPRS